MRRYGLPVLPAIIGMILGPRAELQGRRALQISNGEISGLFSSPLAVGIYVLIALIILWPLINRFVVRRIRKPAHEVHGGHAHALVELAEELAADTDDLDHDESVLARAERVTSRGDARAERSAAGDVGAPADPGGPSRPPPDRAGDAPAPEKAPEKPPEDRS
jgi:hypothetical protein